MLAALLSLGYLTRLFIPRLMGRKKGAFYCLYEQWVILLTNTSWFYRGLFLQQPGFFLLEVLLALRDQCDRLGDPHLGIQQ